MRTGTITIGGVEYPVVGLKVSESMKCDLHLSAAAKASDEDAQIKARMSRVALALQKANAFLPDPASANGQFRSDQRSTDDVVNVIDEMFSDSKEWYDAEMFVMRLNGVRSQPEKAQSKGGAQGESGAEPELISKSGTSPASAA